MVCGMTLKEEDQASAVRRLTTALEQLSLAEREVRAALLQAKEADVSVNRMAGLAKSSRGKIYALIAEAEAERAAETAAPDE
jgi:hypothetical protein